MVTFSPSAVNEQKSQREEIIGKYIFLWDFQNKEGLILSGSEPFAELPI